MGLFFLLFLGRDGNYVFWERKGYLHSENIFVFYTVEHFGEEQTEMLFPALERMRTKRVRV